MKNPVGFKTSRNNSYLHSPFRQQTFLCNPVLLHLFQQESAGIRLDEYVASFRPARELVLPGNHHFSSQEIDYQYKKFRFLKRNGYFKIPDPINLNGRLLPSLIEKNIGSLKQVIFEATEECNLSCTYCTFSKFYINKERGKRKFVTADAIRMLEYIISARGQNTEKLSVSFYGGEPLKNIKFIKEVVSFLQETYGKKYAFSFNLSTNGLLLAKNADFLATHNVEVAVSLDGDEKGNSFRLLANNKPSHALVIKNVDFIRQHYPDYFERCISFLSVLHNRNTFSDVYRYIKERYGKTPLTSLISTLNINEEYKEEFSDTFLKNQRNDTQTPAIKQELFTKHPNVKELANTIEKYTGIFFKNHLQILSLVNGNPGTREFIPTATCLPFSLRVFVAADGTILPCEHISRIFNLGQLNNKQVHLNTEAITTLYNQSYDRIQHLCNKCYLADNCFECVFNTRIETEHPECDFFLDEPGFISRLARNFSQIESDFSLYSRILTEAYHD